MQEAACRRLLAGNCLQEAACARLPAGGCLQEAACRRLLAGGFLQEAACRVACRRFLLEARAPQTVNRDRLTYVKRPAQIGRGPVPRKGCVGARPMSFGSTCPLNGSSFDKPPLGPCPAGGVSRLDHLPWTSRPVRWAEVRHAPFCGARAPLIGVSKLDPYPLHPPVGSIQWVELRHAPFGARVPQGAYRNSTHVPWTSKPAEWVEFRPGPASGLSRLDPYPSHPPARSTGPASTRPFSGPCPENVPRSSQPSQWLEIRHAASVARAPHPAYGSSFDKPFLGSLPHKRHIDIRPTPL
jgi:hypothetical protein